MSRETKFRGLDLKTNEWIYGDLCDYMRGSGKCIMPDAFFATRDYDEGVIEDTMAIGGFIPVNPESVGEYTGLKDKNGKEIYEGDIVKTPVGTSVVEFDLGLFGLNHDYGTDKKTMLGSWGSECNLRCLYDGYNREIEVIGNIYQNPELL